MRLAPADAQCAAPRAFAVLALASALAACSTAPKKPAPPVAQAPADAVSRSEDAGPKRSPYAPAQEDPSKRGDYVAGGLYAPHIKDSAPDYTPNVEAIPEPEVKAEPPSRYGNRTYSVLGKTYRVLASSEGYVEEGMASFYGKKFHGRLTSNQEVYDMYAFSAAHKSLPLPSYVRVTNLDNGKSVVVRVNDRGPFHSNRIIDLSYAAAVKLDFIRKGTTRVEVRALQPGEGSERTLVARTDRKGRRGQAQTAVAAKAPVAAASAATAAAAPADPALRAEEFDRWMRERGVRVATGKPAPAAPSARQAPEGGGPNADETADGSANAAPTTLADAAAPGMPLQGTPLQSVSLQVAAFSTRDNAERAQQRLRDAGLPAVRIDEGEAEGKPLWRLRIGPVAADRVEELAARCAELGFEAVKLVRE
jgi:rare lipoprotein A